MVVLFGVDLEKVQVIVGVVVDVIFVEGGLELVCVVVNDNDLLQVVIFGYCFVIEKVIVLVKDFGVKCVVLFLVFVLFYCLLMQFVVDVMEVVLFEVDLCVFLVLVFVNVDVVVVVDLGVIWYLLVWQVMGMVCWCELVLVMYVVGVEQFVEFGGKVFGLMVKCIVFDVEVMSVIMMDDIEVLVKVLQILCRGVEDVEFMKDIDVVSGDVLDVVLCLYWDFGLGLFESVYEVVFVGWLIVMGYIVVCQYLIDIEFEGLCFDVVFWIDLFVDD